MSSATPNESSHASNAIQYIEFAATDLDATKHFYSHAFGWRFSDYGPDYVAFEVGAPVNGGFYRAEVVTRGGPLVVLYAADLQSALRSVKAAGGAIERNIYAFPGGRRFHFLDPNGNELAVWGA
jgi:predicted enzyme related to lactoylglutathione lyase